MFNIGLVTNVSNCKSPHCKNRLEDRTNLTTNHRRLFARKLFLKNIQDKTVLDVVYYTVNTYYISLKNGPALVMLVKAIFNFYCSFSRSSRPTKFLLFLTTWLAKI
jgi:hypothetical protein